MSSASGSEALTPCDITGFLGMEAPRYTSYPSAHHFSAQADAATHRKWLEYMSADATVSAYVHIPFCKELCWFCGCHTKMTRRYEPIAGYVRLLLREIELIGRLAGGKGRLAEIHFGGGSPGLLEPEDWLSILRALASAFTSAPTVELAIELDPRTATPEKILAYAESGCTRASVGIQDFNPEVQRAVNRIQPYAMVEEAVRRLRDAGIGNINFDLIYGLPHQTPDSFRRTLEQALKLDPARIALFSYAHMPQIKKHQRLIPESRLPGIADKLKIFIGAARELEASGYAAVGMDHFAKPDDPLAVAMKNRTLRRNFQGYVAESAGVLAGFGCSAISQFPQGYAQNSARAADYAARVSEGALPTARGWEHQGDDQARKRVIDDLMCFMSADVAEISAAFALAPNYFAAEMEEIGKLERRGVVKVDGGRIEVITPYRMAARAVAAAFDRYRGEAAGRYSQVA